jgi:putative heme-binding domain-containing protein
VASKGKVSLLLDRDGDDVAEEEVPVASGWKEIPQNVDAVGMAIDERTGEIYFGLGTANYANAYLIDDKGRAQYDIRSERGTIQRVSADFKKRTTVCTGVRFTVALAFDAEGNLFATDQEGATWLPNGNPRDELLHLLPGRHYGFPPLHPRHLPPDEKSGLAVDEPSTFDYGPQHQSTCGLVFNVPPPGGKIFGPNAWLGNALVCGESRGRLYRTVLTKSAAGFLAQTEWLAIVQGLLTDACVSPAGELVLAAHSGPPDWGTGPEGRGMLFKVSFDPGIPQPEMAELISPVEVRVRFDRQLPAEYVSALRGRAAIEYGPHVRAGDRFESLKPPYQAVKEQMAQPSRRLAVAGIQATSDRRTLLVQTVPHPADPETHFCLTLPGFAAKGGPGALPQAAVIDLHYTANGFVRDAATGVVSFKLDLDHALRPLVQAGALLDWQPPEDEIEVRFPFPASVGGKPAAQSVRLATRAELYDVRMPVPADAVPGPNAGLTFANARDRIVRPLQPGRIFLPWTADRGKSGPPAPVSRQGIGKIGGADWNRGKEIFFGAEARCATCHRIRGAGALLGPDLSNLTQRDYDTVWRDISEPSATIHPDHLSYEVRLKNGQTMTGTLRSESPGVVVLGDALGKETRLNAADIVSQQALAASIMPPGLPALLGEEKSRDLMAYLLLDPPVMPRDREGAPPPRRRSEIDAMLGQTPPQADSAAQRPLKMVLVAGPKDHGVGEHDYPAWQRVWKNLFHLAAGVAVDNAWIWPDNSQMESADVLVFFQKGEWNERRQREMDAFFARGGGAVCIHWAVEAGGGCEECARRIGFASNAPAIKFRHGPLDLQFTSVPHPIVRNFQSLALHDESYWQLAGDPEGVSVLANSVEEGAARPQFWALEHKGPKSGRVFVSIPGHYSWTFDDPLFRILLVRGIAWTCGQPVDRFNNLITAGLELAPEPPK